MSGKTGGSDPLVVYTKDFAPHLEAYLAANSPLDDPTENVSQWENKKSGYVDLSSPNQVLAEEAGLDVRRLFAFRNCEQTCITLRVFDQIITAMGMPNLAWDIPIYRNPMWSVRRFMAWLEEQDLTPEDIGVNVDLAQPVPWATTLEGLSDQYVNGEIDYIDFELATDKVVAA